MVPDTYGLPVPTGQPATIANFGSLKIFNSSINNSGPPNTIDAANVCELIYCLKHFDEIKVVNGKTSPTPSGETLLNYVDGAEDFPFVFQANGSQNENYTINFADFLNTAAYVFDLFHTTVGYTGGLQSDAGSIGIALYQADDINAMMGRIADSMSESIRTSQLNTTNLSGQALVLETYLQIQWKWLSLPIAIAVFSFVLLIVVIQRSHARGMDAWKSSSIPLLFYGLEGWGNTMHTFANADDMMKMSQNMKGRMSWDREHRVFVRED